FQAENSIRDRNVTGVHTCALPIFMMQFHEYSLRNTALIQSQFKGAQAVGSYKFWQDKGFQVQKGEKAIQILVPNKIQPKFKDANGKWKTIKKATEQEKELINNGELEKKASELYFGRGSIFDVSQTNAKASDLPDIFSELVDGR